MKDFFNIKKLSIIEKTFIILSILIIILLLSFNFIFKINNISLIKNDFDSYLELSKKIILYNDNIYNKDIYQNQNYFIDYKKQSDNLLRLFENNPPIFYFIFLPFSIFPNLLSNFIYNIICIFFYILSIFLLIKIFKRLFKFRFYIIFFSLLFPPFIFLIFNGNPSIIYFFILTSAFYLSKKDKAFLSGILISFFIFKPVIFIILFLILLLSFRPRLFLGVLTGSFILFFITGIWDIFTSWIYWFKLELIHMQYIFNLDVMSSIRVFSNRSFFYPLSNENKIILIIEFIFMIIGLFAVLPPVIYSFFKKKNFSRNSYWFMIPISIILSCPFLYMCDLIILLLPVLIFLNLMLADRVQNKYIILILISFFLWITFIFILSKFILVQLFTIMLWFFLLNSMLKVRVRSYTPKTFIGYWEDY